MDLRGENPKFLFVFNLFFVGYLYARSKERGELRTIKFMD
jgi:hypothetical protein